LHVSFNLPSFLPSFLVSPCGACQPTDLPTNARRQTDRQTDRQNGKENVVWSEWKSRVGAEGRKITSLTRHQKLCQTTQAGAEERRGLCVHSLSCPLVDNQTRFLTPSATLSLSLFAPSLLFFCFLLLSDFRSFFFKSAYISLQKTVEESFTARHIVNCVKVQCQSRMIRFRERRSIKKFVRQSDKLAEGPSLGGSVEETTPHFSLHVFIRVELLACSDCWEN